MRRNGPAKAAKHRGAAGLTIGIVVSRYNTDITEPLLDGALEVLHAAGVKKGDIRIVRVPGSFEIPYGCRKLLATKKPDAIIALGCIIKGETDHDRYIASAVAHGIMQLTVESGVPIAFGVLTTNTLAQARVRSRGTSNKGAEAATAALECALLD